MNKKSLVSGANGCNNLEVAFPWDPVVDTPLGRIEGSWGLSENGHR